MKTRAPVGGASWLRMARPGAGGFVFGTWFGRDLIGEFGQVAAQPFRFIGQGFSLQGDKGRFVLPSVFRKSVRDASSGDKILCIDKHEGMPCLTAFGTSRGDDLPDLLAHEERMATERGLAFNYDLRAMQLGAYFDVPFDDSGRFVMPRHLLELAKITDAVYFHGAVRTITIWAPEQLYTMGPELDAAKASCRAAEAAARERKS